MKIEAIIVCVNYSDFLSITLKKNYFHFDNIIIVTTPEDTKTQEEAGKYENITIIKTNIFTINNAKFNKGAAINVGLVNLKYKDWVVLIDADIILPNDFRKKLDLEKNCSYGARRFDIKTQKEFEYIEKTGDFSKTCLLRGIGYGFFFMFNWNSYTFQTLLKNPLPYPYWIPNGSESDWIFRNYWSDWIFDPPLSDDVNQHFIKHNDYPQNKNLLKELPFNIIHLGETGINSEERKTKIWERLEI